MDNLYFVDFENLQNIDYDSINKNHDQIVIFAGQNQSKISLDIIKKTQPLGSAVQWIQMEGSGRNSLDFHLSFYLGYFIALQQSLNTKTKVHVISKDADYDLLIKHIQSLGYDCQRRSCFGNSTKSTTEVDTKAEIALVPVEKGQQSSHTASLPSQSNKSVPTISTSQAAGSKATEELTTSGVYDTLIDQLKKIGKLKRPRTQKTLSNFITSHYRGRKKDLNSSKVVDLLKANRKIKIADERISYLF
ncbi:hypothetical protein HZU75_15290 [Chitinibacter fontanus]|uniref:PIN-like domain-containing protein n=1 Tax=Chitinibacter fontanus TaxID=1737446 RepID=A0A7D5VBF3_9NEIS|nr:PIN domain-containing protein [Chitinibacter fontanus]QLI82775.1 hypothetical protein HZU75_15290 [Chitinibacter fontanus]